jgi:predicted nuclease of predicted toxin-antitoxin system
MTLWLDAHLDEALAPWLGSRFGVIAKSLREVGLDGADDIPIFEAARRFSEIVIVSKDADFAEIVTQRGKPPQVLWLRCGNRSTIEVQIILANLLPDALRLLQAGEALVEVAEMP